MKGTGINGMGETGGGRTRVLVLIKGLGLGGAERLLVDSLPYLDTGRFDYEYAYLVPWKDFLVPDIVKRGFKVHALGAGRPHELYRAVRKVRRLVSDGGFGIVHAHLPLAGVVARAAGRSMKVPVIYTEHNLQERYHPLTRWLNGLTYGLNRAAIAVSAEVSESIQRAGLGRKTEVHTLLNGVPYDDIRKEAAGLEGLRESLRIARDAPVVGTVAVFRTQKRLMDWLDVAEKVIKARPGVCFLLVGHGPEEVALREKVKERGLEGRVLMPGFRPDGRRLMGLMDVYLMSSEYEGLPVAMLEAMALSKPVVARAVGGIPEAIEDSVEGFLCHGRDLECLAERVTRLLEDKGLRDEMGERGAEKVRRDFNIVDRVRFTEKLYLEVLGLGA